MRYLIYCIVMCAAILGCTDTTKEDHLKLREQNLLEKEKEFATREADYQQLLALRDSLQNIEIPAPTENIIPEEILGKWNGRMICTESNCADHVIGDQRNDVWEFSPESLKMTNKTGSSRIFTLNITGKELKLIPEESASGPNSSEISLALEDLANGRIKGTRNLTGKNGCVAKFSVELEKAKN